MSADKIEALQKFSACDISDALLKLKVPHAGFVPDLKLYNPASTTPTTTRTYASVSTVLFAPKSHTSSTYLGHAQSTNIAPSTHYVDSTPTSRASIVLLVAPPSTTCAVLGGIMALRMRENGARGIVVHGRVRDLGELRDLGIPVWASGSSTVGAGEGTKVWAKDVEVEVGGVKVRPGDIVCADAGEEGVVVCPAERLEEVLELCPRLTAADERVVEDVKAGGTVKEAFAKHRSNI